VKSKEQQLIEKALRLKCENMDWLYQYTENMQEYQAGVDAFAEIRQLADALGPEGDAIIAEYRKE